MDTANSAGVGLSRAASINDVRLSAARQRLAECSGQKDAIEAVREIVSNFLGSEQMALFHADCKNVDFRHLWSFGIEGEKCNLLWVLSENGLERILGGECHVESHGIGNGGKRARAFIPLRVGKETVAVLAIMELLPQKAGFDRTDMELLTLLSIEAGEALFAAGGNQK